MTTLLDTTRTTKLRVLIAEDNTADVLLIQDALREHGVHHEAEVAYDGEEAFAFLERAGHDSDLVPDLVMLDLNLVTHHGTEVLEHIRNTPGLATIPVVVLTSSNSLSDRQKVKSLGADLYLRKPLDLVSFLALGEPIAELLRGRGLALSG